MFDPTSRRKGESMSITRDATMPSLNERAAPHRCQGIWMSMNSKVARSQRSQPQSPKALWRLLPVAINFPMHHSCKAPVPIPTAVLLPFQCPCLLFTCPLRYAYASGYRIRLHPYRILQISRHSICSTFQTLVAAMTVILQSATTSVGFDGY